MIQSSSHSSAYWRMGDEPMKVAASMGMPTRLEAVAQRLVVEFDLPLRIALRPLSAGVPVVDQVSLVHELLSSYPRPLYKHAVEHQQILPRHRVVNSEDLSRPV